MREYSFRITQEQLHNLGSQLAAKATGQMLLCECGGGYAELSSDCERTSWSFRAVLSKVDRISLLEYVFKQGSKYCVVSSDLAELRVSAFSYEDCLWCHLVDGKISAYKFCNDLQPVDVSLVIGHALHYSFATSNNRVLERQKYERTTQAFGAGTTEYLSNLTVGIVGASGTGSIVAEQLYRLGVKRLVLVDNDYVEERNLGRILNSSVEDAQNQINKTEMLKRAYDRIGMGTEVVAIPTVVSDSDAVRKLSQCDLIFGCLDSADGRMYTNRICTFYTIPYIDMGVKLKSDKGVISEISAAVRYIIPGKASLHSIGAYTNEQVESEALRREDPVAYRERLNEKYIEGAQEGSPAVICVNMQIASLAVLELLNRIHEYRDTPNSDVEVLNINLLEPAFPQPEAPSGPDVGLRKYLGKGDSMPLLDIPSIGV
jgi:molybdopterin/thiamine biosynthesis adenylyltransferase